MFRPALALCCAALTLSAVMAAAAESNPIRRLPVSLGPQTHRIIVGFRTTAANSLATMVLARPDRVPARLLQARTTNADVASLAARTHIALIASRQISSSMHVLFLPNTLYGVHVQEMLDALRADPAVRFADVDERRYPLGGPSPDDPLFAPTPGVASGQWYLLAPNPAAQVEGVLTQDLSATDAVDAWAITTGSAGIVIADVDTGALFAHPDLLRANQGGRLLPGYDFVGEDYDPNSPYSGLGTYLIATDGDGWDPDPSDPGDWISSKDEQNSVFSVAQCGNTSQYPGDIIPSTWHGTRVVGVFGAITNNDTGIAGMTWGNSTTSGPWILPVRAIGKCGGYDSDIIAGIEWAAGLTVTPPNAAPSSALGIPDNPYPADIINLSLGGTTSCSLSYITALTEVTQLGVLVVISAGNGGVPGALAPVTSPANCSVLVPGVIAIAGLRNVGTKVGYSSFGPEVGVSAPAGNCVNTPPLDCLRSIDTTTNDGIEGADPSGYTYTSEQNPNLGTSFSAPIVSGIAALMRSVNANLTPAQLVARLKSSASAFPANNAVPPLAVCPATDPTSGECSCPPPGPGVTLQCGTGMVNALGAVKAALNPIGVIVTPALPLGAAAVLDASTSVASCGNSIASFAWTANPATLIASGAGSAQVTIAPGNIPPGGTGTLTLTVTDSAGNADIETVTLSASTLTSTAPTSSGSSSSACPAPLGANPAAPAAPTAIPSWSPAMIAANATSTLTIRIGNTNGFDLTQSALSLSLPAGLTIPAIPAPAMTCFGTGAALQVSSASVSLANAIIPARGSCAISMPVQASIGGTFPVSIAAGALSTGPAGANTASAAASLTVNTPSGGGGGGGQIAWLDLSLGALVLLLVRARQGRGGA
jgi:serine protease